MFFLISLKFPILEETKAREAKEKELEEVEKKAEDALETIKQLAADRDQLKEKIDELEKNINELIKLVQRHSDGKLYWIQQNCMKVKSMIRKLWWLKSYRYWGRMEPVIIDSFWI